MENLSCQHCHIEKILPNKFSADNNMNLEKIPKELQELTEIEEMLISKVFIIISVYRLYGKQNEYRENVINFY